MPFKVDEFFVGTAGSATKYFEGWIMLNITILRKIKVESKI